MPAYYSITPGATITSNATPSTANDCMFVKPGSTRTLFIRGAMATGAGGGLTALSNIRIRLEEWTTTASSAGTSITPTPDDSQYQAATQTAAFSSTTVTSGTGGPTLFSSFGFSATGPGQQFPVTWDESYAIAAAATKSMDLFNLSATASLAFEPTIFTAE